MTKGSKEGNLVLAALSYAADCVAEGDADRLQAMGLELPDAAMLCSLTLDELRGVGAMCAHAVEVRFDADILRVVVQHLRNTSRSEALQRALVAADASHQMMRKLFGMGSREYGRLRRLLAVKAGVGRPAELDEAAEHRLWHALSGRLKPDPDRPLEPNEMLRIHAHTGVSMRAIWNHARRWAAEGHGRRD